MEAPIHLLLDFCFHDILGAPTICDVSMTGREGQSRHFLHRAGQHVRDMARRTSSAVATALTATLYDGVEGGRGCLKGRFRGMFFGDTITRVVPDDIEASRALAGISIIAKDQVGPESFAASKFEKHGGDESSSIVFSDSPERKSYNYAQLKHDMTKYVKAMPPNEQLLFAKEWG